jgi:hypothetical protein
MPPVQPSASVAATGLNIRYIQDWAFAYSGIKVATGGSRANLLAFTSGSGIIVCELAFAEDERGSNSVTLEVHLNSEQIMDLNYDASPQETRHVYPLLIPPFTFVEVDFKADGTNINGSAWIVGRVYGTE